LAGALGCGNGSQAQSSIFENGMRLHALEPVYVYFSMSAESEFSVSFFRFARSVAYKDGAGTLVFAYDFAMPDGKFIKVYATRLDVESKTIPPPKTENERARAELALQRVKQFLKEKGYQVKT
jgi:hypothetical protein